MVDKAELLNQGGLTAGHMFQSIVGKLTYRTVANNVPVRSYANISHAKGAFASCVRYCKAEDFIELQEISPNGVAKTIAVWDVRGLEVSE